MDYVKKNTLLLAEAPDDDWTFGEWRKNNIIASRIFIRVNKFFRAIRRIWINLHLPFVEIWYSNNLKKSIKLADVVIVHITYLTLNLPKYVNKLNPNAKVIAWYWHIIGLETLPQKIEGECSVWSFDESDCKKYNLSFNHQYYFKSLVKNNESPELDVFFCGADCGRGKEIVDFYDFCVSQNFKVKFQIVRPRYEKIPNKLIVPFQKYNDILVNNLNSRTLLEIMRPGQTGATLRQMEALFQKRKLITNNTNIKNEDFYRPQNIFILGERPLNTLADFINAPYDHSVDKYIDSYDVFSWLKKFMDSL